MATWEDLTRCVTDVQFRPKVLCRNAAMKARYRTHRANMSASFPSHGDYIKATYMATGEATVCVANLFPYNVDPSIKHYVMWSICPDRLPSIS